MNQLVKCIKDNEEWLMHRILRYAKQQDYTKYTSTLAEAWRISISGLSESLVNAINTHKDVPELGPDEDFQKDPIATFGVIQAQRHRARGVTLTQFLGLMKYYRQSFIDLLVDQDFDHDTFSFSRLFVDRFFDRIELGFCVEWALIKENEKTEELQAANRYITNEKNKYLTIFESIQDAVILLDKNNRIENVNHAWARTFEGTETPGSSYYRNTNDHQIPDWLSEKIKTLISDQNQEWLFEREIETTAGKRWYQIKIKSMLDISNKFSGRVVTLQDIHERRLAEDALKMSESRLAIALKATGAGVYDYNIFPSPEAYIDDQWAAILGFSTAELPSLTKIIPWIMGRIHPDDQERTAKSYEDLIQGRVTDLDLDLRIKNKAGIWLHVQTLFRAVEHTGKGKTKRVVGVLLDTTPRKKAEEDRIKKEKLIGVLETAGAVCHELSQPLQTLSGYSELLLMGMDENNRQHTVLKKMKASTEKMGSITRKLSEITKYKTLDFPQGRIIDIERASDS